MKPLHRLYSYCRSLSGLRRWLADTVSFADAQARILRRLEARDQSFLDLVKSSVFDNPRSPYLPLFQRAGCSYADLQEGVRQHGLEGELDRLRRAGVWVSLEEFKGRTRIVRGELTLEQSAADFDNSEVSPITAPGTGGTSGRPVRSPVDLDHLTVRATYQAFFVHMMGIEGAPLALWYPPLPAPSGVVNGLLHAKLGRAPDRWFDVIGTRRGGNAFGRALTAVLVAASRSSRRRLPVPERASAATVLRWILRARDRAGKCAVHAYVSGAVRLSRLAVAHGHDLEGVTFHLGAEPVTASRWSAVLASGAAAWPRYASIEAGTIGVGCGDPAEPGDYHLCRDLIAVTRDTAGASGPQALHFTSLHRLAPKLMINVQLGDCARLVRRTCGCMLGAMGLDEHLLGVHSTGRVTCEGMTVPVAELVRIVEESICLRYGGSPLDYQWVEREEHGRGRLLLRVSPDIANLGRLRVADHVLDRLAAISSGARIAAGAWRAAGTLAVVRERPQLSVTGKTLPFVREVPT